MDYRGNIRFTKSVKVWELNERNTSHSLLSTNERLGWADYLISCCRKQSPSLGLHQKAEKPGVKFCLLTRYSGGERPPLENPDDFLQCIFFVVSSAGKLCSPGQKGCRGWAHAV